MQDHQHRLCYRAVHYDKVCAVLLSGDEILGRLCPCIAMCSFTQATTQSPASCHGSACAWLTMAFRQLLLMQSQVLTLLSDKKRLHHFQLRISDSAMVWESHDLCRRQGA